MSATCTLGRIAYSARATSTARAKRGEAGEGVGVTAEPPVGALVRVPRGVQIALREVEVSKLDVTPGGPLGRGRAGLDRESHRLDGAVEVAVELAQVRDARIR